MADPMIAETLKVVLPPALAGGALLVGARAAPERWRAWLGGLAVALAYGAGQVAIAGWPAFPPAETTHALPWLGLVAALVLAPPRAGPKALLPTLLLAGACTWAMLGRLVGASDHDATARALLFAGSGAALLALWWPVTVGRVRAETAPGALAVVAGGASALALLNHSAKLSQLGGALGVALALVAVLMLVRPCSLLARGAARVGAVLIGAQLLYVQHVLEPPTLELLGVVGGLATLHAGRAAVFTRWPLRRAIVVTAVLAALPVLIGIAAGALRYREELAANPYY